MKGYVYALHGENENDFIYVGATINPKKRLTAHKSSFGYNIGLVILDEIEVEKWKDIRPLEAYWIQQFVAWGFNLVNYNLHYGYDVRLIKSTIEIELGIF